VIEVEFGNQVKYLERCVKRKEKKEKKEGRARLIYPFFRPKLAYSSYSGSVITTVLNVVISPQSTISPPFNW
jgi:hypothetical protein